MVSITAAVSRGKDAPFAFEQLELEEPRDDELLVKITSTGVCHTDLAVLHGAVPVQWPIVLGHEGAGVVEEVGSAVKEFRPGDRVVLSLASCGRCANCLTGRSSYCERVFPLNFGGAREDGSTTMTAADGSVVHGNFFQQSSFATRAIATVRNAVKVPDGIDLDLVGPLGCGIQTGAGSIVNSLGVGMGASLVVSGAGAVGLAAILAARVVGATTIVAVDVLQPRLDMALELGATHVINAQEDDVVARIGEIVPGGADFAFDTTGVPQVIVDDLRSVKVGGTVGLVAGSPEGASLPLAAMARKTVRNILQGDAVPPVFLPQLMALYQRGLYPFDRLVTKYPFAEIERAIADTQSGVTVKAVLTMPV